MKTKPIYIWMPLIVGGCIGLGLLLGSTGFNSGNKQQGVSWNLKPNKYSDKMQYVLKYIQSDYVDTINKEELEDKALTALLEQLDPHSSYVPAEDAKSMTEMLDGNFDGIGVEFNIQNDTIYIVSAIVGGPSEALGIQSGGRIVSIEGKNVAGTGMTNEKVMKSLRGPKGTTVNVGIIQRGEKKAKEYPIKRAAIPIFSLDAAYMVNSQVGYVKISRFSATTFNEFSKAMNRLGNEGMKSLILDLRDNPGGYLEQAVDMADDFLGDNQMIVYTEGQNRAKREYKATSKGIFEQGDLVVLIDEGSASASEIIAGAVQDNDRGFIVGRRSFGKGLVQEEMRFDDGSAMRLTTARYYTPTGRCIQKSYSNGKEDYYHELDERIKKGEFINADSTKFDVKQKFTTPKGRTVYGGGGIMPDFFVALDTTQTNDFYLDAYRKGLLTAFAFQKVDAERKALKAKYATYKQFLQNYSSTNLLSEFDAYIKSKEVKSKDNGKNKIRISTQLKALMARNLYGNDAYYYIVNTDDETMLKAISVLQNKLTIHQKPR
jgi:carboxyl-terminal processing protease